MSSLSRFFGKLFGRAVASRFGVTATPESFPPSGPGPSPSPHLPALSPPAEASPPPPPPSPRGVFGTKAAIDEIDGARVTVILEDGTVARPELDEDLEERLRYIVDNIVPPSGSRGRHPGNGPD